MKKMFISVVVMLALMVGLIYAMNSSGPPLPPPPLQSYDLGLSGSFNSNTAQAEPYIASIMNNNNIGLFRYVAQVEWESFGAVYDQSIVQWFLDNTNGTIVVDRNHIYPASDAHNSDAKANWATVRSNLMSVCQSWPNTPRVWVELINEYYASTFYTDMQGLINDIRTAGYNNTLVIDTLHGSASGLGGAWGIPWQKLNDPLNNLYQGMHYYFDGATWTPATALADLQKAKNLGIAKILNTEVGANGDSHLSSNTTKISVDFSYVLAQCETMNIDNCVWLNQNGMNWPVYVSGALNLPNRGLAKSG